jgi:hypothetical protein
MRISAHLCHNRNVLVFFLFIAAISGSSCGDGMLNEYINGDGAIWTNVPVYVDSTGYAEITVQENGNGPELTVHYSCADSLIIGLHKLDAELLVDGNVIEPSQEKMSASYANSYVDVSVLNCCDSLGMKLGIDSSHYMSSFPVGLSLSKKYPALKDLPKQLSVQFTSQSAGGNSDTIITLNLSSSKDTRAPIRFH